MYEIIAGLCVLGIILVALSLMRGVYKRDETIITLRKELTKEKEKLRLLNLLNPETKSEDGWKFYYDPKTRYVGKKHWQGGNQSVCEISNDRIDYYGHRITKLLNDGYIHPKGT